MNRVTKTKNTKERRPLGKNLSQLWYFGIFTKIAQIDTKINLVHGPELRSVNSSTSLKQIISKAKKDYLIQVVSDLYYR